MLYEVITNFITSELENIPGVGPATIELLFKEFKSLNIIKGTSLENLQASYNFV